MELARSTRHEAKRVLLYRVERQGRASQVGGHKTRQVLLVLVLIGAGESPGGEP